MATMSAAPAGSTLTPPSSSHGTGYAWNQSSVQADDSKFEKKTGPEASTANPPSTDKGAAGAAYGANGSADSSTGGAAQPYTWVDAMSAAPQEASYLSPPYRREARPKSIKDGNSPADSLLDLYGNSKGDTTNDKNKRTAAGLDAGAVGDDENSKWIHRDKLARIESEELQAAGFILPSTRTRSRPRRESNLEKANGLKRADSEPEPTSTPPPLQASQGSLPGPEPITPEAITPAWDLRMPEEIAMDPPSYFTPSSGTNGSSRIPVAKLSPVPIPHDYLERDTPVIRRRDSTPGEEDKISFPKTRSRSGSASAKTALHGSASGERLQQPKRSVTDVSPKKSAGAAAGGRKTSAPAKAAGPNGRQKSRNGPSKDSTSSSGGQTRPSTRSGELSPSANSKAPEGEPPWMVSAYRPDPRLPPDQQLLPTVAKRLQQEKWEREGKFGNVYDKEFRPLTDDGFREPPPEAEPPSKPVEEEKPAEWPLKPDIKAPALSPVAVPSRTGSYSTIPRIQEKPNFSPLNSPRVPMQQNRPPSPMGQAPENEEDQEESAKKGCACCIVM